jgi:hypothetical protein
MSEIVQKIYELKREITAMGYNANLLKITLNKPAEHALLFEVEKNHGGELSPLEYSQDGIDKQIFGIKIEVENENT